MNNRVVILYSQDSSAEISPDNQDTLVQLAEITDILNSENYTLVPLAFNNSLDQLASTIHEVKPDCIFNLVETINNENKLQYFATAFIEYLGFKYTGCPAWSLAALASKTSAKQLLLQAKLPTPDFVCINKHNINTMPQKGKWIVKPDTERASFGIDNKSIIDLNTGNYDLETLWNNKSQSEFSWFLESFISGREFNVSILDNGHGQPEVLTPVEMTLGGEQQIGDKILDYAAKWLPYSTDYDLYQHKYNFPVQDNMLIQQLISLSESCWRLFGLKGAARIDFRVDHNNQPWIVDINANPCLTSDAGLMVAAKQFLGLTQKDVILKLLAAA